MPRVKQTEENLLKQLAALDEKRRSIKKRLQVMRIRAAAQKRKALFTSIRKNEKEVIEVIKTKAPDFFKQLMDGSPRKPRAAKKAVRKRRVAKQ
jgi:hypothetical protein